MSDVRSTDDVKMYKHDNTGEYGVVHNSHIIRLRLLIE